MAAPINTIKLNLCNSSTLEFEVAIQGIDDNHIPVVKFAVTDATTHCDYTYKCTKIDGKKYKWKVDLPPLSNVIQEESIPFHVEVIVDGYYFEPAHGVIEPINVPTVSFDTTKTVKPSVTTTFTVVQAESVTTAGDIASVPVSSTTSDSTHPIIKQAISGQQMPAVKGSLFARNKQGKAVIKGLDTAAEKALKVENSNKVRDILHNI